MTKDKQEISEENVLVDEMSPSALSWMEAEFNHLERLKAEEKLRNEYNHRIYGELSEPFPPEVERELKKSGTLLTYIPVSEVITRLNRVLGVTGWSSEIIRCERDHLDPDFIVAHVRLTVHDVPSHGFGIIQKDGFGGQKIKRTKQGDIVDLGDEFKGAVSDALKKAAQQLGIALYLSRSDEALNLEIEQDNPAPVIDPKVQSLWDKFRELSKDFSAEQRKALGDFWTTHSGGRPKPTPETATPKDVMALIEESTRLAFPGSEFTE